MIVHACAGIYAFMCNDDGSILGNVQFNWPKLFQAFFVILSLICFHRCIHSIIPHQYM